MPALDNKTRATLKDSAFAYIDAQGRRRLPINDAAHVRNALARFEQVAFEDDAARERARLRLLRAAKKHGIVPLGFFDGQIRKERAAVQTRARTAEMARWPRGTVTFLFTDIEGSTALLRRLGDGYPAVLRDARSIIRRSVKAAGGHEVDSRADEFFAAFARPGKALAAAIAVQSALAARTWPGGHPVRVRIGVHSGRSTLSESGYVGIAVNTAARVCDAGHGGQILVSISDRHRARRACGCHVRAPHARSLPAGGPRRSRGAVAGHRRRPRRQVPAPPRTRRSCYPRVTRTLRESRIMCPKLGCGRRPGKDDRCVREGFRAGSPAVTAHSRSSIRTRWTR